MTRIESNVPRQGLAEMLCLLVIVMPGVVSKRMKSPTHVADAGDGQTSGLHVDLHTPPAEVESNRTEDQAMARAKQCPTGYYMPKFQCCAIPCGDACFVCEGDSLVSWPRSWDQVRKAKALQILEGITRPSKVRIDGVFYVRKQITSNSKYGTRTDISDSIKIIAMEELTNVLYGAAGVPAQQCKLYPNEGDSDTTYMLCLWIEGLKGYSPYAKGTADEEKEFGMKVRKHFVLDAVLANYDLGGNVGNIGLLTSGELAGEVIRVDQGGSLGVYASGSGFKRIDYPEKGDQHDGKRAKIWSPEPFSVWDFPVYAEQAWPRADLYKFVTPDDIKQQIRDLQEDRLLHFVDPACPLLRDFLQTRIRCLKKILQVEPDLFDIKAKTYGVLPEEVHTGVQKVCGSMLSKIKEKKWGERRGQEFLPTESAIGKNTCTVNTQSRRGTTAVSAISDSDS